MKKIPLITLERYPDYCNYLLTLGEECERISSGAIAKALGLGEVLVRKDLAYTDCVGKPRLGYNRVELIGALRSVLKCDVHKNAAVIGVGKIGHALLSYERFEKYGITLVCGLDENPDVLDENAAKPIYDAKKLNDVVKKYDIELAVICVPDFCAQTVCDEIVASGVKRILTFAPTNLKVPDGVIVRYMDLAANLAVLASC